MTDPIKSSSSAHRTLAVADRIYWDGDMANPSHTFVVVSINSGHAMIHDTCEASRFGAEYDCGSRGSTHSIPASLVYGPRWGWQDERAALRRASIAAMAARLSPS